MEKAVQWLEAIVTVVFDLEEGQLPDLIIPEGYGSEKDRKTISYNSFPDSNTFNNEGYMVYSFYLRKETSEKPELVHCFACFNQKKDPQNPRGYFQKSVVFLTKIRLYQFFKNLFQDVAKQYFTSGDNELLKQVFKTMNEDWPQPIHIPDIHEVTLIGKNYEIKSEKDVSYKNRFNDSPSRTSAQNTNGDQGKEAEAEQMQQEELKVIGPLALCDDFKEINIFTLMGKQRSCLIFKLWEAMMLNESILILADSPVVCSELVFTLQSIMNPFVSSCEVYPYITVFDKEVDVIRKNYQKCRDGVVIGCTNPLFAKNFEDFPNILRMDSDFEKEILKKNLIMKTVKTNSLLKTQAPKRAKGESLVKKFLTKDLSAENSSTNNAILRKKLEKLSFGVAGLISTYFSNQKNVLKGHQDLKFFDGAQFLKEIKEKDGLDLADYFGGKADFLKFMTDFICCRNFQNYIQKYFNVHIAVPKSVI